ncbi:YdcF family protein [bacterium]|nr:YdcF family protein [bacterium]
MLIIAMFGLNRYVTRTAAPYIYNDIAVIPKNHVGLLLGTIPVLSNGRINLFFVYRINAACDLYNSGKIDAILVSGDNHVKTYNEPEAMRQALIQRGIPESKIHCDYAGFRTLDSVVRCKQVFGQQSFTIISQKFHNERAVYIARKLGIDAIAYNAKDVNMRKAKHVTAREFLAKPVAVLDALIHRSPRFLGEKIQIP